MTDASAPTEKVGTDPFRSLTWEDVEAWAGSKIVSRGRSYQRSGSVKEIGRTEEGAIIAWVQGTEKEWLVCLARLRHENLRKRRLIEILDNLEGRRIIDK